MHPVVCHTIALIGPFTEQKYPKTKSILTYHIHLLGKGVHYMF
jgi:hypothetical protein